MGALSHLPCICFQRPETQNVHMPGTIALGIEATNTSFNDCILPFRVSLCFVF